VASPISALHLKDAAASVAKPTWDRGTLTSKTQNLRKVVPCVEVRENGESRSQHKSTEVSPEFEGPVGSRSLGVHYAVIENSCVQVVLTNKNIDVSPIRLMEDLGHCTKHFPAA